MEGNPAMVLAAADDADDAVLLSKQGRSGRITLNRPRAINALTHPMVLRIDAALSAWEYDDEVAVVVLDGAGGRGLCAGGDIRAIRDSALADGAAARAFWRDEYRLNARIARFRKPFVAAMDGIVMGGGVGLSAHAGTRIVTERSRVAMPEVGIGFVPDVGGTYLLSRAPGETGTHLALTADAMAAADAILCGFADHFIPSARLAAFLDSLAGTGLPDAVRAFAEPAPPGGFGDTREWIDACYSADTVEEIVERLSRLADTGELAAKEAARRILGHSPTALKVTLRALRRARALASLEDVLDQEYRVSSVAATGPDLPEGVRAQVVDKDRSPRWTPDTLAAVTDAEVERHFA
ncbi:enoyl-CoA hydratase/isomerase family protein [Streptomyces sp. A3M-1-3]|uniref:enoyl-CoA hydratase/isomerase family protein n=1 Tax=Streptomyces sp. A3M-1-3 TaxID=2962044 RepID=UPI0020B6DDA7|nr:enoyl-CoA hydratase/isomerase family protein [Streptomyces sp. A3M-1-3]MCP3821780.1 enoyl-CoA hydratase/isomerase family protein [Streptomyces sp. A3M-1-3]